MAIGGLLRRLGLAVVVCGIGLGAGALAGRAEADTGSQPALELHLDTLQNGTTPDSSGNNLTANAHGTLISDGRFDHALDLSASGDQVNVANNAVLAPAQVTVMAWVRQSGWQFDQALVVKPYAVGGCNTDSYGLTSGLSTGVRFIVDTNDAQGVTQHSTPESSTASVWDGQWHAIAGTYDGSTINLYQDGALVGSAPAGPSLAYDTDPADATLAGLYAGVTSDPPGHNCAENQKYSGAIDEIRVYDRALSAQEIATLQNPAATTPPELGQPSVTTGSADALTTTTATLHGTVNPQGSTISDCHFEYGTSTGYGSTAPCAETVGNGTTDVNVHADLSGLPPHTTYHFRLVATSGTGTGRGSDATFTTSASAPEAITESPDGIGVHSATLHGIVYPYNETVSDCHFEYGTSSSPHSVNVPCAETVGGGYGPVTVHADVSGLSNNTTYQFRLVATNGTGTGTGSDVPFTTAAVDTSITGGPSGPTNQNRPTFTFTADPAGGASFSCWLDSGASKPCSSPWTPASPLTDGPHTLHVQAASGGNVDPTPATRDFFVDTVPPVTAITVGPDGLLGGQLSSGGYDGYVSIGRSASDPAPGSGVEELLCALDPASAPTKVSDFGAGSCPLITNAVGEHVVYAVAVDNAGNVSPIAAAHFQILPVPDTSITSGPEGSSWNSQPSFRFTSTIPGSTFRCRMDGSALSRWQSCSSPYLSAALSGGQHTFEVQAVSPAGVPDPTPASSTFGVNQTETESANCQLEPFLAKGANPPVQDKEGCWSFTPGDFCGSAGWRCQEVSPGVCPAGAECTITERTSFADQDPGGLWNFTSDVSLLGAGEEPERSASGLRCKSMSGPGRCQETISVSGLGAGQHVRFRCSALDFTGASGYGPDASRRLECDATLVIAPASALATVTQGATLQVLAPATGTLLLAAVGGAAHAPLASASAVKQPVFKAIRRRVRRVGVVDVRLQLSRTAARTLKRRHRLVIRVRETFSGPHGLKLVRTRTLMLRPAGVSLNVRCARNQRLRKLRICRSLHRRR